MSQHPIVHIEIVSKDPKVAGKFYQEAFGWKIVVDENLDYVMFDTESGLGGGFPGVSEQENIMPGDVLLYIGVDDIEAALAKVETCGGKTLIPRSEIPGTGWFAFFTDPNGTRMGIYQSMNPSTQADA